MHFYFLRILRWPHSYDCADQIEIFRLDFNKLLYALDDMVFTTTLSFYDVTFNMIVELSDLR